MSYWPFGQVVVAPGELALPGGGGVGVGVGLGADTPGTKLADGPGEGCFGTAPHPARNKHTNSDTRLAADFKTLLLLSCEALGGERETKRQITAVEASDLRYSPVGRFRWEPLPRRHRPYCGLLQLNVDTNETSVAVPHLASNRACRLNEKFF